MGPTSGLEAEFPGVDAAAARRAASIPAHRFAQDCLSFKPNDSSLAMIDGYNQRGDDAPGMTKWCCACYAGARAMANMTAEQKDKAKVVGWHKCSGCRCWIHTSIFCGDVRDGDEDGHYFCGHCHAVATLDASNPPAAGFSRFDRDGDIDDSDDGLEQPTRGCAKPGGANKKRCSVCQTPGHNKRRCPQRL